MDPMSDVKLDALVAEIGSQMVDERRKMVGGQIKALLLRVETLTREVRQAERELEKKKGALRGSQEKIEKLRKGDWSVLEEPKGERDKSKERFADRGEAGKDTTPIEVDGPRNTGIVFDKGD